MRLALFSALAAVSGFGLALLVGGTSSFGAQQSVSASGVSFSPANVTISVGDSVKWTNQNGTHNVHFDGEAVGQPASAAGPNDPAWANGVTRTFEQAGTFRYYCDPHKQFGMEGIVTVQPASSTAIGTGTGTTTTPTGTETTTTPTGTGTQTTPTGTGTQTTPTGTGTQTTPTDTNPGGGTDTGGGTTTETTSDEGSSRSTETREQQDQTDSPTAPRIRSASLERKRFCARRAPSCRRPGVRFAVRLTAAH